MGKANQVKADNDNYGFRPLSVPKESHSRLDLNNLINRIKEEKKKSRKLNLFIFSGTTIVVAAFLALLSI